MIYKLADHEIRRNLICVGACGNVPITACITILLTIRDETGC
jgi:hypothetical protein